MALEREVWQAFITNNSGDVQPNAQITVFDAGTSNLSTIYSGLTGSPRSNPFNTGTDGLAKFYAEPARYRVQAQSDAGIAVFDDVDLSQKALREDLADPESDVLIAGFPAREFNDKINELQSDFDGFIDDSQQDVNQFINDNQTTINRLEAEEKLKRNAVVYLDFCSNEGKEADDFTINRATATDLIDYAAPDGVSVQTADGRIVFAPADTAAIGWNSGECVGLVSAPASTNLLLWSEDFTQSVWSSQSATEIESTSEQSPVGDSTWNKLETISSSGRIEANQSVSITGLASMSVVVRPQDQNNIIFRLSGVPDIRVNINIITGEINSSQNFTGFVKHKPLAGGAYQIHALLGSVTSTSLAMFRLTNQQSVDWADENLTIGDRGFMTAAQAKTGLPTPYSRTEASQVTRGAIDARKSFTDYKFNQFTIFLKASDLERAIGTTASVLSFDSNTIQNRIQIRIAANRALNIRFVADGQSFADDSIENNFAENPVCCIVYDGSTIKTFTKLAQGIRDSRSVPVDFRPFSNLLLAGNAGGSSQNQGAIFSKVALTATALTDAEATSLVTLEDE